MDTQIHIPEVRACEECGAPMSKRPKEKTQAWNRRRFCNHSCARTFGPKRPLAERFEKKVLRGTGCHIWTGSKGRDGYGSIKVGSGTMLAHRVAYLLRHGSVPDDRQVLHHCDNPSCVNSDHLFLGDHAANMADMASKGRGRSAEGALHHAAKLDPTKIRAIRIDSRLQRDIAAEYGVSGAVISAIKRRKTWKHVA